MKISLGSGYVLSIHQEGYKFIGIFALVAFVLSMISPFWGIVGMFLTLCCIAFFRDPERISPLESGLVLSPADGIVTKIQTTEVAKDFSTISGSCTKISIFLSVFDVHVNRVPVGGEVIETRYHPGKFLNASLDKASEHNERNAVVIKCENGDSIGFVQIAGLIARRIVSHAKIGDKFSSGQRYGIIRFGSRLDIYLPSDYKISVSEGQRMVGGETVLAKK
jgi:phosphatidylserine decarboxylase